jgi:hypothetical protein
MAETTVLPANLQATFVGLEPIAVYKKMVFIDKPALGEEVADLLGPNKAVILKGHGGGREKHRKRHLCCTDSGDFSHVSMDGPLRWEIGARDGGGEADLSRIPYKDRHGRTWWLKGVDLLRV